MLIAWTCAASAPLRAEPLPEFRKPSAHSGASALPKDDPAARCARYGEGFVPVVGSDGCVKIGGRLRIDLGASAPRAFASPGDGISPAAHLRLGR